MSQRVKPPTKKSIRNEIDVLNQVKALAIAEKDRLETLQFNTSESLKVTRKHIADTDEKINKAKQQLSSIPKRNSRASSTQRPSSAPTLFQRVADLEATVYAK